MSSINFLNNIAQNIAPSEQQAKVQQPSNQIKKSFVHGNNVIIINGIDHKGYFGFVQEFVPGKLEVEIDEEGYVSAAQYGPQSIGSIIQTHLGNSLVTHKIPALNVIVYKNQEVRLPINHFMRTVLLQRDSVFYIAEFVNSFIDNGILTCEVRPIEMHSNSKSELLEQVSHAIRNNKLVKADMTEYIPASDSLLPDYYFVVQAPTINTDKNFVGFYGTLKNTIDEQYRIIYKRKLMMFKNALKQNSDGTYIVKHGPFKGRSISIVKRHPSTITVFLNATGKSIKSIIVKKDSSYQVQPLTPKDVFYLDLKLKNGNFFQVQKVLPNGNFYGIERAATGNYIDPREISQDIVAEYQPGFALNAVVTNNSQSEEEQYIIGSENNNDNDNDEDVEQTEYETMEDQQEEQLEEQQEQEYTGSFKDNDRVSYQSIPLTPAQQAIKTTIENILNAQKLKHEEINIYDVISTTEEAIKNIKRLLQKNSNSELHNFWVNSDNKYIIACVVFYEIVKVGFAYLLVDNPTIDTVDKLITVFTEKLVKANVFQHNDTEVSLLLTNWHTSYQVDKSKLKQMRKSISIYTLMFNSCQKLLDVIFELPTLDISDIQHRDTTLFPVYKEREVIKRFVTMKELLHGEPIPEQAKKVLFGPAYIPILNQFKKGLNKKVTEATDETTKDVFSFIMDNIQDGPFVIKRLEELIKSGNGTKVDEIKYKKFKAAWEKLINTYIKVKVERDEQKRYEASVSNELQRKLENEKRTLKRKLEESLNDEMSNLDI
jgi:hypothetical protein